MSELIQTGRAPRDPLNCGKYGYARGDGFASRGGRVAHTTNCAVVIVLPGTVALWGAVGRSDAGLLGEKAP